MRAASEEQFDPDGGINAVESLAGKEIATYIANLNEGVAAISPSTRLFMTQQSLEPLIRARAEDLGAAMRYTTELTAFEQDADGVTGFIRNLATGATETVRAKYMIAADGNRSPIRARLGISTRGPGHLADCVTIYFHADCAGALRGRNLGVIYVFNPALRGFFRLVRTGDSGFLAVMTRGDMARPDALNVADGIDKERAAAFVRAAIGLPDVRVTIGDIAAWRAVAEVAERLSERRVFLVGDAAHVMPPMGGFGGNTGVQDTHNLAWKLALVLKGIAGPQLLATYNAERQPVGELAIQQAYTRYVLRVVPERGQDGMQPIVPDLNMEIGYGYRSSAVVSEPGNEAPLHGDPLRSEGRPARARRTLCLSVTASRSRASIFSPRISAFWRRRTAAPGARPQASRRRSLDCRLMRTKSSAVRCAIRSNVLRTLTVCHRLAPFWSGPTGLLLGARWMGQTQVRRRCGRFSHRSYAEAADENDARYLPLKAGLRFSMKAVRPSA